MNLISKHVSARFPAISSSGGIVSDALGVLCANARIGATSYCQPSDSA